MASSKRRFRSAGSFVVAALLVIVGIGVGAFLATRRSTPAPSSVAEPSTSQTSVSVPVRPRKEQTVDVYVVRTVKNESRLVPEECKVPARSDRYEAAVECLLREAGSPKSAIPVGTKLRSLTIGQGLATVDLSREFVDNFNGGSDEESLAVNAIVKTLGQFGDVQRVQFLVEGRKIGTLGGHFELEDPVEVLVPPQRSGGVGE